MLGILFRPFGGVGPPAAVPEVGLPAGRTKPRRLQFSVELEGQHYVFRDIDSLIAFVTQAERKIEKRAEEKGSKDAKRIISLGPKEANPEPPVFQLRSSEPEISEYAEAVERKVTQLYWRSLADALAREAEEWEDIKYIASLDI